jgi:hypothetical protein
MNEITSIKKDGRKTQTKLFRILFSSYFYRIAFRNWNQNEEGFSLSSKNIRALLNSAWEKYESKINELEKQGSLGNWLVMNFAYLTLAAYQVLVDNGTEKDVAIERIRELTWDISSTWAIWGKNLTKYIYRNQMNQLNYFVGIVMKTLFSPPGYKFERGKTENGYYLDVKLCPVADLMIANDAADLCITTWCGVDFGLVDILGGNLQRKGTLAMGEKKCDFVISPAAQKNVPN